MFRRIRSRVGYANVVATLALVFAMSGSAYALVVNGALVVDESLTEADVRDGSLRAAIADDAITSSKVVPDALTGDDIDESTLSLGNGGGGRALTAFGSVHDDMGSSYQTVVARTLPPGKYALSTDITFRSTSSGRRDAICGIEGSLDSHNPQTTVPDRGAAVLAINSHTEIGGTSPFPVRVICAVQGTPFGEPSGVTAFGTLNAVEVSAIDSSL